MAIGMLAVTAQNSEQFGRLHPWILLVNVAGLVVLATLLVGRLLELLRDFRHMLRAGGAHPPAYAEVQGLAAALYGLSSEEFALVLESFPLVEAEVKAAAAGHHRRLAGESDRVYTLGGGTCFQHDSYDGRQP